MVLVIVLTSFYLQFCSQAIAVHRRFDTSSIMPLLAFDSDHSMESLDIFCHVVAYPFDEFILKHRKLLRFYEAIDFQQKPELLLFIHDLALGESHYAIFVSRCRSLEDLLVKDWPNICPLGARLSMTAAIISASLCGQQYFAMAEEALFVEDPFLCKRCVVLHRRCGGAGPPMPFYGLYATRPAGDGVTDVDMSMAVYQEWAVARFFSGGLALPRGPLLRPWVPNSRGTPEDHAMNTLKAVISECRVHGYSNEWLAILKSAYSVYPEYHPYIIAIQAFKLT